MLFKILYFQNKYHFVSENFKCMNGSKLTWFCFKKSRPNHQEPIVNQL